MLKTLTKYSFAFIGLIMLFSSCKKEYESIESIDERLIQEYLTKNNLSYTKDPSGYYYKIVEQGTGSLLTNSDSVLYTYDLKNFTGTTYSSTIAGSNEGTYVGLVNPLSYRGVLTKMNRGGKFSIILPSHLAFGKNGSGTIPSNEIILSEVAIFSQPSQAALDETRIVAYLTEKGLLASATRDPSSGVYYIISVPGAGSETITTASTITGKYTGRLLNGTVFDSSTDGTFAFSLTGVIPGWGRVIPKLRLGGKIRFFVPSAMGYGTSASGSTVIIPANSVLDFDVEVTKIVN
jgi:FKBP-type peptidyl-prolyl cis-trans isomerase FkpA